ncbi:MAG: hypothetical protein AB7G75_06620 [Candidatus Binatia bacterium]
MRANTLPRRSRPAAGGRRKATLTSSTLLEEWYTEATLPLSQNFSHIDAWLADYGPDLWQQIHQEDDELFRLRQLGVSEYAYRARLNVLLTLCQQAEQLYYEARPQELSLPALAPEERVAIYFELADGTIMKAGSESG